MNIEILKEAAQKYPSPFYLFDIDEARAEIGRMRRALPQRAKVCFSIKANPFLTGYLGKSADYVEACSFGELRICERVGVPEEKIVLSGVNKGRNDLLGALSRHEDRIVYTAESMAHFDVIEEFAEKTGKTIRVLPRLTDGSQFGMNREEIEDILEGKHGKAAKVIGIHFFSGTQKKNMERTLDELEMIDRCLADWKERYGFVPEKLEFGSGMSIDYFAPEEKMRDKEEKDLQAIAGRLSGMQYQGEVTLEFGRRIAATCGSFVTAVADVKTRTDKEGGGHRFAIVDGGIHQVTWYGQMMGMKVPPVFCLEKPEDPETAGKKEELDGLSDWSVFGSLCSMNDVLLRSAKFPPLNIGDHLVFGRCGAYSPTEGILMFLSRNLPAILTYSQEEGLRLARKQLPTDSLNSAGSFV